jgi:hypothetical protein
MGPLDALWHVSNFIAPALGVAMITSALAKWLVWRRALAGVAWGRLFAWSALAGIVALGGGLVILGRDGAMATYGALVVAVALGVWGAGFARR